MSYPRLAARLYNVPLMLSPDKAEVIEAVFRAYVEGRSATLPTESDAAREEAAAPMSLRRTEDGYYVSNAGVAVLPVHGTLVQRAGGMDAMSGMTGYNQLASRFSAAMRDPNVRGLVLEVDSSGGEVAGAFELASIISSADNGKPVWTHANELAASAAYLLGSQAERLYAPATGLLGSIGVLMLHVDRSGQAAKQGLTYTPIFAGARKIEGSSLGPLSEEARAAAQARVDQVHSMFVDAVARGRPMKPKAIRDTEAGVFSMQDAVRIGLADGVATLGDTIQMLTDELNAGRTRRKPTYSPRADAGAIPRSNTMPDEPNTPAATTTTAATDQQMADARAKAFADGKAEGSKEAATAATDRIKGIMASDEAKNRQGLASHFAFDTSMTVDDARKALAKSPEESAAASKNPLAAAMPPNPKVGADVDAAPARAQAGAPRLNTASIYSKRAEQAALKVVK